MIVGGYILGIIACLFIFKYLMKKFEWDFADSCYNDFDYWDSNAQAVAVYSLFWPTTLLFIIAILSGKAIMWFIRNIVKIKN